MKLKFINKITSAALLLALSVSTTSCVNCSVLNKLTLSQSQRSKNLCLITMNQRKYCYYISM